MNKFVFLCLILSSLLNLNSAFVPSMIQARQSFTARAADGRERPYQVRKVRGEDYGRVIASVDEWWSGRTVSPMLPRLFFDHFCDTSFVVVQLTQQEQGDHASGQEHYLSISSSETTPTTTTYVAETAAAGSVEAQEGHVVGFLCGFISQARPGEVSGRKHASGGIRGDGDHHDMEEKRSVQQQ